MTMESKPASFIKTLPSYIRHTFYYDLRAAVLFGVFGGLFFPFMLIVGRKIGATDIEMALLSASPYLANAFAIFWAEDILGKGRVWYVVWPNAAGRTLLAGMFFVTDPAYYTALIFVYMLVTAIPFPSYASIMKTNYPDDMRGRLMSYVRVATALFWIISAALAGWYLEKDTSRYKYLFPTAAVFGALSALQFGRIKVRGEKKTRERFSSLSGLAAPFRDRPFLTFLALYSVFEFSLLIAFPVYPIVLVDEVRISNIAAGIYGALFSGAWLAGFFFWGRFIDRFSMRRTLAAIFLTGCLTPLIYMLTRNVLILSLAQLVSGFLFAATELMTYVVITRLAAPKDVPRYMAASVAIGGIRGATAPFLGTALYGVSGPLAPFTLSLVLGLAAFTLSQKLPARRDG
ncbi:MAG: MFS transporter [Deltaproteobacteria bacterium]|nr:MFS transporter [Deltaproteobacteria bacterium]MBI5810519.1 MFS transporter [Deltaproteobacteria bacterium]